MGSYPSSYQNTEGASGDPDAISLQSTGLKCKALYAYTASPDGPNELSLEKGEVLDILNYEDKWWQVKKLNGASGLAPSNYLMII